jgi:hypothetical protein
VRVSVPLVSDPLKIDPDWLTAAIGFAGRVKGFTREAVGTGQMGRSVRFRLEWEGDATAAPASVVGKFPSDDPRSRATGTAQGAYEKEVRFYGELAQTVDIRTPHCFFADVAPATGDFVLLLEDLAPARQGDQLAGCGVDRAALAIAEAARLHAPRWGDPGLPGLGFLRTPDPDGASVLQAIYQSLFPGFAERYQSRRGADDLALFERLGPRLAPWVLASGSPLTLVHGDFRLDNMLFGAEGGPTALAVVDWQTVALGPGPSDVSYFLGAGMQPDERRRNEAALLRDYHDRLLSAGVSGYDWDRCHAEYRRSSFCGIVMTVVASMIVEQTERGDDMFMAMASRHAAHARDLEAETLLGQP